METTGFDVRLVLRRLAAIANQTATGEMALSESGSWTTQPPSQQGYLSKEENHIYPIHGYDILCR
jgi:hypothetical protein